MRPLVSSITRLLPKFITSNKVTIRFYPRWSHRTPVRILTPDGHEFEEDFQIKINQPQPNKGDIIELNPVEINTVQDRRKNANNKNSSSHAGKQSLLKNAKYTSPVFNTEELYAKAHFTGEKPAKTDQQKREPLKYTANEVMNTTFDKNGNYVYEKMRDNDPKVGTLMVMIKSKKLRQRREFILLEGKRLIKEALEAGCAIQHLMFSRKNDLEYIRDLLPKKDIHLYKMAYRDIQMWSDLTTSPGIMGIFKTPNLTNISKETTTTIPLTIICDNIREPGNLGAILRASVAAGSKKIILTKGCVDIWDPKVLRSACSAHFRTAIQHGMSWPAIVSSIPDNTAVFLADNNILTAENSARKNLENICLKVPVLPYYGVNFRNCQQIILIIGGETMGLSQESYELAVNSNGVRLNIPLTNGIESLNTGTAFGVIAFEMKRQLLANQ